MPVARDRALSWDDEYAHVTAEVVPHLRQPRRGLPLASIGANIQVVCSGLQSYPDYPYIINNVLHWKCTPSRKVTHDVEAHAPVHVDGQSASAIS